RSDLRWVEVVAPIMVRFGVQLTVEASTLRLHVEGANTVKGKDVVAGIFVTRGDETIDRHRAVFRNRGQSFPKAGVTRRVQMSPEFSSIKCMLTYRGRPADSLQVLGSATGKEPVRWAVFGAAVGSPSDLQAALLSTASMGDRFEH